MIKSPVIPTYLIVHIGEATDNGKNIRVPFIEYIKNNYKSSVLLGLGSVYTPFYLFFTVLVIVLSALVLIFISGVPIKYFMEC